MRKLWCLKQASLSDLLQHGMMEHDILRNWLRLKCND